MISLAYKKENKVSFKGKSYELNVAFDLVLSVFEVINDEDLDGESAIDTALYLLTSIENFDLTYKEKQDLLEKIFKEQIGETKEEVRVQRDRKGNVMPVPVEENEGNKKQSYSFEHDADFIYASFIHAYNIDLENQRGKLSWDKFKALLNGLPEDTIFRRVVEIRESELPKGKHSEKERERLRKLKKIYELPTE